MEEEMNKKERKKKVFVFIIVSIIMAIIVTVGVMMYFRYESIEEEKHRIAVATVDEVTYENLSVDYNKDFTNEDIFLTLKSTSEYELIYKIQKEKNEPTIENAETSQKEPEDETEVENKMSGVEENGDEDYKKYEEPIQISENSIIFLKYINIYGTYSRNEYKIEINNIDKEKPRITKKEANVTTNTVKVDIEAIDNIAINKIEASIDGENYKEVLENTCVFEELQEGTEYTVKIRVQDNAGNTTEEDIKATTKVTLKPEPAKTQTKQDTNKNTNTNTKGQSSSSNSNSASSNTSGNSSSGELTKAQKEAEARVIAKQIAKESTGSTQLESVRKASQAVYGYYKKGIHKETGDDYYTAYGVFILGESSCAGCCRALGMVLNEMGIKWKHINENKWTHQWLEVTMDGQKGWADANIGLAGYGEWGY